jgi:hypothetical protein
MTLMQSKFEKYAGRPLDLIDAGCVAADMSGAHVSATWLDGDRPRAAVHGPLVQTIIAFPPDWGLTLFVGTDEAWLWINAEEYETGEAFQGPNGPVLAIRAGDLQVNVETVEGQEVALYDPVRDPLEEAAEQVLGWECSLFFRTKGEPQAAHRFNGVVSSATVVPKDAGPGIRVIVADVHGEERSFTLPAFAAVGMFGERHPVRGEMKDLVFELRPA